MYEIEGAVDATQLSGKQLPVYPEFQHDLEEFKKLVVELEKSGKGATFVHFGDGDYYFLKKQAIGSAQPGRRALSIPYEQFDITPFIEGWKLADYHCVEYLEEPMRGRLEELFPGQQTIATEFLYGLTMNRWFLKTFKGKVGLIGAGNKLQVIRELMKYPEYQEYLGIEKFNDYISIPQKFACDDLRSTVEMVREQLEKADPETTVFLYGVGHVKSGLIHQLKAIKPAVYLDVGGGMDGLAGVLDPDRPYAKAWINHRMRDYDYTSVDLLNYNISDDKNIRYL
jgi:hypothetical protein